MNNYASWLDPLTSHKHQHSALMQTWPGNTSAQHAGNTSSKALWHACSPVLTIDNQAQLLPGHCAHYYLDALPKSMLHATMLSELSCCRVSTTPTWQLAPEWAAGMMTQPWKRSAPLTAGGAACCCSGWLIMAAMLQRQHQRLPAHAPAWTCSTLMKGSFRVVYMQCAGSGAPCLAAQATADRVCPFLSQSAF